MRHTFNPEPYSLKDALIMNCDLDGRLIWSRTWGEMGLDLARSVAVVKESVYVTGMTYGVGNDKQAFLLKYLSPNKSGNQMVAYLLTTAILAIGIILWMTGVREVPTREFQDTKWF